MAPLVRTWPVADNNPPRKRPMRCCDNLATRQSVLRRTIGEQLQESIPITSQLLEEVVDKVLPYERFRIMPSYNEKTGEITIDLEFEGAQSA